MVTGLDIHGSIRTTYARCSRSCRWEIDVGANYTLITICKMESVKQVIVLDMSVKWCYWMYNQASMYYQWVLNTENKA